jgi:hypothetical protein
MQKDEEVGKVAQATPVVICNVFFQCLKLFFFTDTWMFRNGLAKALELFLALIIEKSSSVSSERGSKRVEVYHL